jgi:NADH:ubiquinone oxidoreductase subunit K
MIRVPRPHEIRLLPQIENAADLRYAAIGLAILVSFFRNRGTIDVEDVNVMKG